MSVSKSFVGPQIDDFDILKRLPVDYVETLNDANGFIAFEGGLHIRGACKDPSWHALRFSWEGEKALQHLYKSISDSDIPFGQDCFGDQFLIRDSFVIRLSAETGQIEPVAANFLEFLTNAYKDPIGFLSLQPLIRYRGQGGVLTPGQLLSVYPPFCVRSDGTDYSIKPVPAAELISSLAAFALEINDLPEGQPIRIVVK